MSWWVTPRCLRMLAVCTECGRRGRELGTMVVAMAVTALAMAQVAVEIGAVKAVQTVAMTMMSKVVVVHQ